LPSTEFLVSFWTSIVMASFGDSSAKVVIWPCSQNLCIQLFFTRFNPVFPIVHAPTFRPSAKSSLLLLSICSIGSLFVGSNYAVTQGSIIFERLNKAILSSVS
jgi:hypothetical protein